MAYISRSPPDRSRVTGVSPELEALLLRQGFLSRLDVILDYATLDRVQQASVRASKSPSQIIADLVRAAYPGGPNLTVVSHLQVCADDLRLLESMAAAAGKTLDDVVSDILFQVVGEERELRKRMEDRKAQYGTHSDRQAGVV